MNAIVSLCHFCEVHGPSVVLCTQAIHAPESETETHLNDTDTSLSADNPAWQLGTQKSGPFSWDFNRHPLSSDSKPGKTGSSSAPSSPTQSCPDKLRTDVCEACSPYFGGSKLGCMSRDDETQISYISTNHPRHPEVFSIVRHACLRSLSCETCPDPDREGPVFFGDEHQSQVLSFSFTVKDSQARGLKRVCSITVVMMDKTFLLNSWPFLVKHIRLVVDYLKKKCSSVFDEERSKCPTRSLRNISSHRTVTTSAAYRLERGSGKNKQTRSLTELTGDKMIFRRLHNAFTWMLKAGGARLVERLLEGPPTEGCMLDIGRIEETEEGFVKVYSKVGMTVDVKIHHRHVDADPTPAATVSTLFSQLRKFAYLLGRDRFHVIAHHILIGNQVIVRSPCKLVAHTILDSLKMLLPKGCCRTEYYSDVYVQSYKFNFLGVKQSVDVPLSSSLCILIDVTETPVDEDDDAVKKLISETVEIVRDGRMPDELKAFFMSMPESSSGPHSLLVRVGSAQEIVDLSTTYYRVLHAPKLLPSREPSLLDKIEKILFNDSFADSVAERSLQCLKDDWMMKVKRLFMFSKFGERTKEEMDQFNKIIDAHENDKIALRFWMSGLPGVEYQLNNSVLPVLPVTRAATVS